MLAIEKIYEFNEKLGLINQEYSDFLETSFQIEEAIENANLEILCKKLSIDLPEKKPAKEISRFLVKDIFDKKSSDLDRLDKHLDSIVFSFGSIFKLGLSLHEAMEALNIVMNANMQKLSSKKDEFGKIIKPEGYKEPDEELMEILNKRK